MTPAATPTGAWWAVLACYAVAKLVEMADRASTRRSAA